MLLIRLLLLKASFSGAAALEALLARMASFTSGGVCTRRASGAIGLATVVGAAGTAAEALAGALTAAGAKTGSALWLLIIASTIAGAELGAAVGVGAAVVGFLLLDRKPKMPFLPAAAAAVAGAPEAELAVGAVVEADGAEVAAVAGLTAIYNIATVNTQFLNERQKNRTEFVP
jgi:hypothetical protein